jgi:hypothetical protein
VSSWCPRSEGASNAKFVGGVSSSWPRNEAASSVFDWFLPPRAFVCRLSIWYIYLSPTTYVPYTTYVVGGEVGSYSKVGSGGQARAL